MYNKSMQSFFLMGLFLVGTIIGSFVCCQAWRVRYGEEGKKDLGSRSVCLHCGYKLKWYDNIPIFSWLYLRGRCRKCRKKIGVTEILVEVGMGAIYLAYGVSRMSEMGNYGVWNWMEFLLMLVMFGLLGFLAIYDGKWGELPQKQLIVAVAVGMVISMVGGKMWTNFFGVVGGVGILAGIYYILYKVSHEKLVGSGDWILGLAIAFVVGDWWLALWVLCIANLLGTIVAMPAAIKKKQKKIYFGPYLAVACVIVVIFTTFIEGLLAF